MSKLVEAHNGYVFFDEVSEQRTMSGGFEIISEHDQDFRYSKGKAYSVADGVPLKEGDLFLYEVNHAFEVYVGKKMLKAVQANRILGKVSE